jgi:hypothetical protein
MCVSLSVCAVCVFVCADHFSPRLRRPAHVKAVGWSGPRRERGGGEREGGREGGRERVGWSGPRARSGARGQPPQGPPAAARRRRCRSDAAAASGPTGSPHGATSSCLACHGHEVPTRAHPGAHPGGTPTPAAGPRMKRPPLASPGWARVGP